MAVIPGAGSPLSEGIFIYDWDSMGAGDTGAPVSPGVQVRVTITVTGGPGVIQMEGSNDETNWRNIEDLGGNGGALTEGQMIILQEVPLQVRPRVVSGSALVVRLVGVPT